MRTGITRCLSWALPFAAACLLAQSVVWSDHVSWALKVGVGVVGVLAAWRPAEALLVLAGIVPLGHVLITSIFDAYPFAADEAFVLAFLAGYLWRERRGILNPITPSSYLTLPSRLFGLVVLASCFVHLVTLQVWHDYPLRYAASYVSFLATEYLTALPDPRPWVDGRGFIATAAAMLEGVALLGCVSTLCARQPGLGRRVATVAVAAGVGVAMLSVYSVLEGAFASGRPLTEVVAWGRWTSPAIPSIDTAGTYFALVLFAAVGLAATSRASVLPGLVAAVLFIVAMLLVRTRSAIVASLAVVAAGLAFEGLRRLRWLTPMRSILIAAFIAVTLSVVVVRFNPFHLLAAGASRSLYLRVLLAGPALRMIASAPLTGIGVGQYEMHYTEFASRELLRYYSRNNAHNYFLWIGAELGLIGLGLFLWLLVAALARASYRLRSDQPAPWFVGVCAGLTAFIITWSVGQPLGVPQVAFTFWILLGVAAAPKTTGDGVDAVDTRRPRLVRLATAATVVVVVASVPLRASREIADIDLSRVSYGFYGSGTTPDQQTFRWAGPRVTFFMRSSVGAVEVPLAALLPTTPNGVRVHLWVNGRELGPEWLRPQEWRTIRLSPTASPGPAPPYWRVDMRVSPIGIPASVPSAERRIAVGPITAQ